jgi:hypothetical protein
MCEVAMKFHAVLQLEGKTATGFRVPAEVVAALGRSRRPPVRVTINGYTFRTTVAAYGEISMIGVSAENRQGAGVKAGDELEVEIELDTEPRVVEVPPDFAAALVEDGLAGQAFEKLSYSHKRQHVLAIEDAKTPETRRRRIDKALQMLREGKR